MELVAFETDEYNIEPKNPFISIIGGVGRGGVIDSIASPMTLFSQSCSEVTGV